MLNFFVWARLDTPKGVNLNPAIFYNFPWNPLAMWTYFQSTEIDQSWKCIIMSHNCVSVLFAV